MNGTLARLALAIACLATSIPSVAAEEPAAATEQAAASAAASDTIKENMAVQLEYTLTTDGQVVDTTDGRGPFQYVHGRGQIVPGLERQLTGLKPGDSRDITVTAEEGYGPVDPQAVVEVPKTQLPQQVTPEVGAVLRGVDPDGRQFRATIQQVKDQSVMLDLNHPLAGKTLLFKVKVLSVAPATAAS
jgi:FKBP-type peptidyl-prolyl cis-trans isomerase 2